MHVKGLAPALGRCRSECCQEDNAPALWIRSLFCRQKIFQAALAPQSEPRGLLSTQSIPRAAAGTFQPRWLAPGKPEGDGEFGLRFLFLNPAFRPEVGSKEEKLSEYEDKKAAAGETAFSRPVLFCSSSAFPGLCEPGACYLF